MHNNDTLIGTEELAHLEMVGAMVSQLTRGATAEDMKKAGLEPYYTGHGAGVYPQSAAGIPWSAMSIQSTGNPVTDLYENMAAEAATSKRQQNNCVVKRLCCFF